MSDHHRRLLRELLGEAGGLVRGSLSKSPEERAASAERWAALEARAAEPAGDGFREDLHAILGRAVDRLEALHDEVLPGEPREPRPDGTPAGGRRARTLAD